MSTLSDTESKLSTWWSDVKDWFKRSETIAWARLQVLGGFLLAVFSAVDWTQVTIDLDNARHALYLAAGLIINGIWTEYLRRRNATLPSS